MTDSHCIDKTTGQVISKPHVDAPAPASEQPDRAWEAWQRIQAEAKAAAPGYEFRTSDVMTTMWNHQCKWTEALEILRNTPGVEKLPTAQPAGEIWADVPGEIWADVPITEEVWGKSIFEKIAEFVEKNGTITAGPTHPAAAWQETLKNLDKREESVLMEAERIVNGARQANYGSPEDNFANIARLWNGYLVNKGITSQLAPLDVAMMMILLKIARHVGGAPKRDNLVDIAGYALCADMIGAKK